MDDEAPPNEQRCQLARYVSYAMYCLAGTFAAGAVIGFAINWWSDQPLRALFGVVSMLGASGYVAYQAKHFGGDPEQRS